jgi:hypothetical protein
MKLNLLPTYVTKGAQGRSLFFISCAILAASAVGAFFLNASTSAARNKAREEMDAAKVAADAVNARSLAAQTVANVGIEIQRNLDLHDAMQRQNTKYTDFYRMVRQYVPSYMRVNNMAVSPIDENTCQLSITGVMRSYQNYSDACLALLRIPGALQVGRAGFNLNDDYIPNLQEDDNVGLPHRLVDGRKPPTVSTGLDRGPDSQLAYLTGLASQASDGFTGTGGFGTPTNDARTAMPDWSDVTFNVILAKDPSLPPDKQPNVDFRTPNPRQALAPVSGAPAAAPGAPAGGFNPNPVGAGAGPAAGPPRPPQGASEEDR